MDVSLENSLFWEISSMSWFQPGHKYHVNENTGTSKGKNCVNNTGGSCCLTYPICQATPTLINKTHPLPSHLSIPNLMGERKIWQFSPSPEPCPSNNYIHLKFYELKTSLQQINKGFSMLREVCCLSSSEMEVSWSLTGTKISGAAIPNNTISCSITTDKAQRNRPWTVN